MSDGLDCNLDNCDCDCNCDGCDCDCNCDGCDCGCGDCFTCDCADGCDCLCGGGGGGGGGCCDGDNVICCCFPFPASNNNNRRNNSTRTPPDCSIFCCCCLSPNERAYPARRDQESRASQQSGKKNKPIRRRGFCSRLWCCFTGNRSPDSSPSSSPPPQSKTQEAPPRNFPRDGRYPMHEERLDMPPRGYYKYGTWKYGDEMSWPSRDGERQGRFSSLGERDMPMPPRDYHDFQVRWSKPTAFGDYERRFKN